MKIIETQTFQKLAASWDDQPGFAGDGGPRYRRQQPGTLFVDDGLPDSEEDIVKRWKRKKIPLEM